MVAKRGPEVESKPEEPSKKDDIRKEKLHYSRGLSSHPVAVINAESFLAVIKFFFSDVIFFGGLLQFTNGLKEA